MSGDQLIVLSERHTATRLYHDLANTEGRCLSLPLLQLCIHEFSSLPALGLSVLKQATTYPCCPPLAFVKLKNFVNSPPDANKG